MFDKYKRRTRLRDRFKQTPARGRWRKERRDYVIKRKEAQAGIAKQRKWVVMWIAVIVVAIVTLAIFVMNKMSITGILF